MENVIRATLKESLATQERFVRDNASAIAGCAERLATCITAGNKLMLFGNGGSAADAQHVAAEFVNRFQIERPPLAALALTTDTSILTSIGNDYDYADIFAKQIKALGRRDDVAVGISTSGNSPNVLNGIAAARAMGMFTVGFTGRGGRLADMAHCAFRVDSAVTARIQETHILLAHMLCDLVDRILFPEAFRP